MASPIEDYALLGDTHSAALVARDGSIDWLTFPRFDSAACFAALLGTPDHGRWLICPQGEPTRTERRYRDGTLVLETEFTTAEGTVAVIDFMPPRDQRLDVVRIVEGRAGRVPMRLELVIRFDYGDVVPWVRHIDGGISAIAGPDALRLLTPVDLRGEDLTTVAEFSVDAGDRVPFVLTWHPSHDAPPPPVDAREAVERAEAWWREWSDRCRYDGEWADDVSRSLVVLKGLTYGPTGGIVAAPTTSLPEDLGGSRNWDYRYCWLRDATFTLMAMLSAGYTEEASAWREWLLRAVAGEPDKLHIMYGAAGEQRLPELELPWLPGYEGASPVRTGNAASSQFQLDVYGEVMDALYQARVDGLDHDMASWDLQRALLNFLEGAWDQPDEGIWEVRGPRQHFTHSKVMAWVAFDRAVRSVEQFGLEGPVDRWRRARQDLRAEILERGVDDRGVFVQHYDTTELDASLLTVPLVGFLPPRDDRVRATVEAIERELTEDGLVLRYRPGAGIDGLPGDEGTFLLCSFWLADNYGLLGRRDDAVALYERLLGLRNDVGLLSEQYDTEAQRLVGNFPQAFSHIALVNTATNLCTSQVGAAAQRGHDHRP